MRCGAEPLALVAGRVIQGFAGGLITPQVSGFIQTLFQRPGAGQGLRLLRHHVGISTAIGPLLGGALIAAFGPPAAGARSSS